MNWRPVVTSWLLLTPRGACVNTTTAATTAATATATTVTAAAAPAAPAPAAAAIHHLSSGVRVSVCILLHGIVTVRVRGVFMCMCG